MNGLVVYVPISDALKVIINDPIEVQYINTQVTQYLAAVHELFHLHSH